MCIYILIGYVILFQTVQEVDFSAQPSRDVNGEDLPNRQTIRYYYNLGCEVRWHIWLQRDKDGVE